jgi:hypothetical protein
MIADLRVSKSRMRFSDLDRPEPFVADIEPDRVPAERFHDLHGARKPLPL